jgi:hypothetical protein
MRQALGDENQRRGLGHQLAPAVRGFERLDEENIKRLQRRFAQGRKQGGRGEQGQQDRDRRP